MSDLHRIKTPVANLMRSENGPLDRQLLFGDGFYVSEIHNGWAKGCRNSDGYSGYVDAASLAGWADPTNRIADMGAHIYPKPDIKSLPLMHLPFQADLTVVGEIGDFAELAGGGYVHQQQIEPLTTLEPDTIRTAERFLGVPYLWGGNSQYGLDCSGLVSAATKAAGINCPADSGEQEANFGEPLAEDTPLIRGDLIFWKGHVGLMTSADMLLHANGYHMKVVCEPLVEAVNRIAASGGGNVTSRKRVVI